MVTSQGQEEVRGRIQTIEVLVEKHRNQDDKELSAPAYEEHPTGFASEDQDTQGNHGPPEYAHHIVEPHLRPHAFRKVLDEPPPQVAYV